MCSLVQLLHFILAAFFLWPSNLRAQPRSFTIDYAHDTFLLDGRPFRYISGSMHYFRVPRAYWRDRLRKMFAAGLNAVETYIAWNYHEVQRGVYWFDGDRDVVHFVRIAQEEGLYVILRVGPYICAEWDMGGLPGYLIELHRPLPNQTAPFLRSSHPLFLATINTWFSVLLPRLQPLLYERGGPILLVQMENEYGSFRLCDKSYMAELYKMLRSNLGENVIIFTTDGNTRELVECGSYLPYAYPTIDFGPCMLSFPLCLHCLMIFLVRLSYFCL